MEKSVRFILDTMRESNFAVPAYVGAKSANSDSDGIVVTDDLNDISIHGQENVWMSMLKLGCRTDMLPVVRQSYANKIADAALRYGIAEDVHAAAEFIDRMDIDPSRIRTEGDWQRSKHWLQKNAGYMDIHIREGIVDHLFEKAAELGYIPSLSEKCLLYQIAERNPGELPEVQQLAEANIHKLASGRHYTTDQFAILPFEEVNDLLPDLTKRASLGMSLLQPDLFAKAASAADVNTATVLDAIFQKHGQSPVYDDSDLPYEINDRILAAL